MAATTEPIESFEALAEALRRDERVFSDKERELLSSVLQQALHNNGDESRDSSLAAAKIALTVGEAIARRMLESVRATITDPAPQIAAPALEQSPEIILAGPGPKPGPGPQGGPGPKPGPGPQGGPGPKQGGPGQKRGGPGPKAAAVSSLFALEPGVTPEPITLAGPAPKSTMEAFARPGPKGSRRPGPKGSRRPGPKRHGPGPKKRRRDVDWRPGPHPPTGKRKRERERKAASASSGSRVVVLDEFLAPQELERLVRYVAAHQSEFEMSEVVAPGATATSVDFEHRKSRVLFELGEHEAVVTGRILSYLPRILSAVGLEPFPIAEVEAQITASNDGDYFRPHEDNGEPPLQTRELTFVYFFHRDPKPFSGGELRIYDPQRANGGGGDYRAIVPRQNQLVCFPSHLVHEITPVECPSRAFRDSRFTLNGWFHRPE